MNYLTDVIIVGAGITGCTIAERLAANGKKVLIVENRNHIAGNCHDSYNEHGILIHKYGPHCFHTNNKDVWDYLSRFTDWHPFQTRVRAWVDGQYLPLPINLDTVNNLYGYNFNSNELEAYFKSVSEPIPDNVENRTSEHAIVSKVGRDLYNKFFKNYTRKQWDLDPSELDYSVCARIPVRTNKDDRYFTDVYQASPLKGFTKMMENMLDSENISILLQTDYKNLPKDLAPETIYTGPIDTYFGHKLGPLPYRSLKFDFVTYDKEVFQPFPTVNYPNEYDYTRIAEYKYITGQFHPKTTVSYEYPSAEGDPYYPIPRPDNRALYQRYAELAKEEKGVWFAGRLGTYNYLNIDQACASALKLAATILGKDSWKDIL